MAAKKTPSSRIGCAAFKKSLPRWKTASSRLQDSVRLYKEGLTLSRSCREQLEKSPQMKSAFSPGKAWSLLTKRSSMRKGNRSRRRSPLQREPQDRSSLLCRARQMLGKTFCRWSRQRMPSGRSVKQAGS